MTHRGRFFCAVFHLLNSPQYAKTDSGYHFNWLINTFILTDFYYLITLFFLKSLCFNKSLPAIIENTSSQNLVLPIYQDMKRHKRVSSPREFHPQALAEPYVNLSAHTAPIIQSFIIPFEIFKQTLFCSLVPPISG